MKAYLMSSRLLIFSPWFPPHRNSESIVAGKFVRALNNAELDVDVISLLRSGSASNEDDTGYWKDICSNNHIVPSKKPGKIKTLQTRIYSVMRSKWTPRNSSWAWYSYCKARELLGLNDYCAIMSRNQPPISHLPAMWISEKYNIPWIVNWADIEPAEKAPIPYGGGLSAHVKKSKMKYFQDIVERADCHIFPSEESRDYMGKIFTKLVKKSIVIPHVASETFNHAQRVKKDGFTICHAGSFDGKRRPDTFFQAMANLITVGRIKCSIQLVGNHVSGQENFFIPRELLEHTTILPWQDYPTTLEILRQSDVLLLIEAPMERGIYLPGKFVDYVQCGRPVLAISPNSGTINRLLNRYGGGVSVEYDNLDAISCAVEKMYHSWLKGKLTTEYPTVSLYRYFSEYNVVEKYRCLLNSLGR